VSGGRLSISEADHDHETQGSSHVSRLPSANLGIRRPTLGFSSQLLASDRYDLARNGKRECSIFPTSCLHVNTREQLDITWQDCGHFRSAAFDPRPAFLPIAASVGSVPANFS
jgi:hypothetical protein